MRYRYPLEMVLQDTPSRGRYDGFIQSLCRQGWHHALDAMKHLPYPHTPCRISVALDYVKHHVSQRSRNDKWISGFSTGFEALDSFTDGLLPGTVTVVAGRPDMGNFAFAQQIAVHTAIRQKLPIAIFSGELSVTQLCQRMVCQLGEVGAFKLAKGQLDKNQLARFHEAANQLDSAEIYLDETAGISMNQLVDRIRYLRNLVPLLGLIVIDDSLLMGFSGKKKHMARISHERMCVLKAVSKEMCVPVFVTAPVNRKMEDRKIKWPRLKDFPGSALLQSTDVVLFTHRDEIYERKSSRKGRSIVIVSQNRFGPIGYIDLSFDAESGRFHE